MNTSANFQKFAERLIKQQESNERRKKELSEGVSANEFENIRSIFSLSSAIAQELEDTGRKMRTRDYNKLMNKIEDVKDEKFKKKAHEIMESTKNNTSRMQSMYMKLMANVTDDLIDGITG